MASPLNYTNVDEYFEWLNQIKQITEIYIKPA